MFWSFPFSPTPHKSKSISLFRLQNMKSALVERCQSSKMWSSMWNTPLCIIHTSVSLFWWPSFLGVSKSYPIVVRLCHVQIGPDTMTHDPDREIIISHWCSMWSLPSRIKKIKQPKKDFCKWPIVDWFSWSLDVASKCDQEQLLHCNHLHFKSNIFWQPTLLLILVERIIFRGCFGAFVSFCDIIVFMLCTCLSSKVILID